MVLLGSLFLFMSGCASIVSKWSYPVEIKSNPSQAEFTIVDGSGKEIYKGVTPATVNLKGKLGYFRWQQYEITFSKEGYCSSSTRLIADVNGWYWGNFLFGGFIGFIIIDPVTGAMWRLPGSVTVNLEAEIQEIHPDADVIQVVSLESVPLHQRNMFVPLEIPSLMQ